MIKFNYWTYPLPTDEGYYKYSDSDNTYACDSDYYSEKEEEK